MTKKNKHIKEREMDHGFMSHAEEKRNRTFLNKIDWPNISMILGGIGVALVYIQTNFNRVDTRLDKIDDRIYTTNEKIATLQEKISVVESRLSTVETVVLKTNALCSAHRMKTDE